MHAHVDAPVAHFLQGISVSFLTLLPRYICTRLVAQALCRCRAVGRLNLGWYDAWATSTLPWALDWVEEDAKTDERRKRKAVESEREEQVQAWGVQKKSIGWGRRDESRDVGKSVKYAELLRCAEPSASASYPWPLFSLDWGNILVLCYVKISRLISNCVINKAFPLSNKVRTQQDQVLKILGLGLM